MCLVRKILRGHFRTVSGNVLVKFEVRIFNHGEAIGVYPPKFTGHVTLAQPLLEKIFRVFFRTVSGHMHLQYLH